MVLEEVEWDGQGDFFLWFYNQYNRYLLDIAQQACFNSQEMDDLVQTVWVKLLAKDKLLRSLSHPQRLNYISVAVVNTARQIWRKGSQVQFCSLDSVTVGTPGGITTFNENFDRMVRNENFGSVWQLLDENVRELLERKYLLNESIEEIAQAMGVKPSSVRMYISRARRSALAVFLKHKDKLIE